MPTCKHCGETLSAKTTHLCLKGESLIAAITDEIKFFKASGKPITYDHETSGIDFLSDGVIGEIKVATPDNEPAPGVPLYYYDTPATYTEQDVEAVKKMYAKWLFPEASTKKAKFTYEAGDTNAETGFIAEEPETAMTAFEEFKAKYTEYPVPPPMHPNTKGLLMEAYGGVVSPLAVGTPKSFVKITDAYPTDHGDYSESSKNCCGSPFAEAHKQTCPQKKFSRQMMLFYALKNNGLTTSHALSLTKERKDAHPDIDYTETRTRAEWEAEDVAY